MRSSVFIFLVALVGMFSCKPESGKSVEEQQEMTVVEPPKSSGQDGTMQKGDPNVYTTTGHDFTYLTDKLWHYDGAVGPKELGDNLYEGEWIDFSSDGTFKAGKWGSETHNGTWLYNEDKKLLYIHPKGTSEYKITEWSIMFNDKMMVWQGTSTYGNNSIQARLRRYESLPVQTK